MADRPIFIPVTKGTRLVAEVPISFRWNPGMAPSQKKKNVVALHAAAKERGIEPVLEVSSKSELEIGRLLSAFNLPLRVGGRLSTVESVYQGSKVFDGGGPYQDIYELESREAKTDPRVRSSGRLRHFEFEDKVYPLSPATAFYDWLYLNALFPIRAYVEIISQFSGFSDIEFNPERSLNCQARTCAVFVALQKREQLDDAVESFDYFASLLGGGSL